MQQVSLGASTYIITTYTIIVALIPGMHVKAHIVQCKQNVHNNSRGALKRCSLRAASFSVPLNVGYDVPNSVGIISVLIFTL